MFMFLFVISGGCPLIIKNKSDQTGKKQKNNNEIRTRGNENDLTRNTIVVKVREKQLLTISIVLIINRLR